MAVFIHSEAPLTWSKAMINQQQMKLSDIINYKVKDLSSLPCQPSFDLKSKALEFFELLLPQKSEQEVSDYKFSEGAPKDREGNISIALLCEAENRISAL